MIRLTCGNCNGSGRLHWDNTIEPCGVCCENGYIDLDFDETSLQTKIAWAIARSDGKDVEPDEIDFRHAKAAIDEMLELR